MSQAVVNFRMDAGLKKDMEELCAKMGITPSSAYNMFAKKATQEQRIPFEISAISSEEREAAVIRRLAAEGYTQPSGTDAAAAFDRINRMLRPVPDFDYERELEEYREEKYGD